VSRGARREWGRHGGGRDLSHEQGRVTRDATDQAGDADESSVSGLRSTSRGHRWGPSIQMYDRTGALLFILTYHGRYAQTWAPKTIMTKPEYCRVSYTILMFSCPICLSKLW
jgi:hypothetical protein